MRPSGAQRTSTWARGLAVDRIGEDDVGLDARDQAPDVALAGPGRGRRTPCAARATAQVGLPAPGGPGAGPRARPRLAPASWRRSWPRSWPARPWPARPVFGQVSPALGPAWARFRPARRLGRRGLASLGSLRCFSLGSSWAPARSRCRAAAPPWAQGPVGGGGSGAGVGGVGSGSGCGGGGASAGAAAWGMADHTRPPRPPRSAPSSSRQRPGQPPASGGPPRPGTPPATSAHRRGGAAARAILDGHAADGVAHGGGGAHGLSLPWCAPTGPRGPHRHAATRPSRARRTRSGCPCAR